MMTIFFSFMKSFETCIHWCIIFEVFTCSKVWCLVGLVGEALWKVLKGRKLLQPWRLKAVQAEPILSLRFHYSFFFYNSSFFCHPPESPFSLSTCDVMSIGADFIGAGCWPGCGWSWKKWFGSMFRVYQVSTNTGIILLSILNKKTTHQPKRFKRKDDQRRPWYFQSLIWANFLPQSANQCLFFHLGRMIACLP